MGICIHTIFVLRNRGERTYQPIGELVPEENKPKAEFNEDFDVDSVRITQTVKPES